MSVQLRVRRYLENVSPDTGSAAAMAWCPCWGVSVFLEISRSGFSKAQQRQVRADFQRSRHPACAACAEPFEESGSCSSLQKSRGFEVTAGSGCCTLGCQLHPRVPAAPERVCIPTEGPGLGPRLELHYSYLVNETVLKRFRRTPWSYNCSRIEPLTHFDLSFKGELANNGCFSSVAVSKNWGLGGWLRESVGKSGFS